MAKAKQAPKFPEVTAAQVEALRAYVAEFDERVARARAQKRDRRSLPKDWKESLLGDWYRASRPGVLHALRNSHGPDWLLQFEFPAAPAPVVEVVEPVKAQAAEISDFVARRNAAIDRAMAAPKSPADRPALLAIAKTLGFDTLESQKSDRLDFKEVSVWGVREALEAAFLAGRASR